MQEAGHVLYEQMGVVQGIGGGGLSSAHAPPEKVNDSVPVPMHVSGYVHVSPVPHGRPVRGGLAGHVVDVVDVSPESSAPGPDVGGPASAGPCATTSVATRPPQAGIAATVASVNVVTNVRCSAIRARSFRLFLINTPSVALRPLRPPL
jgi:hypothetical protein